MPVQVELFDRIVAQRVPELLRQRAPAVNPVRQPPPTQELIGLLYGASGPSRIQISHIGPSAWKEAEQRKLPPGRVASEPVPPSEHSGRA